MSRSFIVFVLCSEDNYTGADFFSHSSYCVREFLHKSESEKIDLDKIKAEAYDLFSSDQITGIIEKK